jgi:hypothetical protein
MRFTAAYKLKVKPVLMQDLGEYRVTVSASDGMLSTTVSFILSITNTAPYFIDEVPKEFTMAFNNTSDNSYLFIGYLLNIRKLESDLNGC